MSSPPPTWLPEWAPQDAVMLTWPHAKTDWAAMLTDVQATFVEIAKAINQYQALLINCHTQHLLDNVRKQLCHAELDMSRVDLLVIPNNDSWARDHGPLSLTGGYLLNAQFNGWGSKYSASLDNDINQHVSDANHFLHPLTNTDFVLEGGSIESDGNGTVMTTTQCLLNPNRNAHLSRDEIESTVLELTQHQRIIWLTHGHLAGDDTDSHIDTLARFMPNNTIVFQGCDDPNDEHFEALNAMKNELSQALNADGKPYTTIELPWPSVKTNAEGQRLPATYANFLIINGAVLLPVYNDAQDQRAINLLAQVMPKHDIIPIRCTSLIQQFGSLHCVTMQLTQGSLKR
nr:agmatine deiminase family protein [Echinimonas agarilytica]